MAQRSIVKLGALLEEQATGDGTVEAVGYCDPNLIIFTRDEQKLRRFLESLGEKPDDETRIKVVEGSFVPLAKFGVGESLLSSGTLGCVAQDALGNQFGISTEHGFFHAWDHNPGRVIPGLGKLLHRGDLRTASPGTTDAVLIQPETAGDFAAEPYCGKPTYIATVAPSASISHGPAVAKCGSQDTRYTEAEVCASNATVPISFKENSTLVTRTLKGQILVKSRGAGHFAQFGDSGSLVVLLEDGRPLGLLCACTNTFQYLSVCPLDLILATLGAQLGSPLSVVPFP
jgi:hypothetical protein